MSQESRRIENDLSVHVFTASAALVGACLTVIGLFNSRLENEAFHGDEFIALDALFFLVSCLLAFFSLKTVSHQSHRILARLADAVFLIGLAGMVFICVLIAYEFV